VSAVVRGFLLYATAMIIVVSACGVALRGAPTLLLRDFFLIIVVLGLAAFAALWMQMPTLRAERWR
jgi:hypothetical protein